MEQLEQQIDCLEIKQEGIRLEYEYVNEIKNRKISLLHSELEKQKTINELLINQNKQLKEQLELKNKSLEQIQNSRWWKLRNILKREK